MSMTQVIKKHLQPAGVQKDALNIFKARGGILRTVEILKEGIHPRTLYAMEKTGIIVRLGRGMYRLSDRPPLENPDFVMVAKKVPKGVICLISALSYHHLTTQIPHEVYLAIPRGSEYPRLEHPPIRIFQMAKTALKEGIEIHVMDDVPVRIYCPEKTIADCFKFRNRIGMDTTLEALRFYRERKKRKTGDLMHYASICRVSEVMRPYLEAIL